MSFEELKKSGVTENTPDHILFGAGTIHKGLVYGDVYMLTTARPSDWTTSYTSYYTKSGSNYTAVPSGGSAPSWTASTYYRKSTQWNFEESLYCATSGGGKFSVNPELVDVKVDGVLVKAKGLTVKQGEKAVIEFSAAEIKPGMIKDALFASDGAASSVAGYNEIKSKADIETGDYVENFGYIGHNLNGKPLIIIFDNALCTSGLEVEKKESDQSVPKMTFECHAELSGDVTTLPWHIYYPTPTI